MKSFNLFLLIVFIILLGGIVILLYVVGAGSEPAISVKLPATPQEIEESFADPSENIGYKNPLAEVNLNPFSK